jgi:hypothetical protein
MWAVVSLIGLLGMFIFGILAVITSFRGRPAASYFKFTVISFVVLVISLVLYKH